MDNAAPQHSGEQSHDTGAWLVGDHAKTTEQKEDWRRIGFRPSFVKYPPEQLSSLSRSRRQTMAKEFLHDGASFFQRGFIHYGLQLWREATRIDPDIEPATCGYDNDTVVSLFKTFKDEHSLSQPVHHAASDILYGWLQETPSAHLYRASSKFIQNARCAYCGTPNILRAWPPRGDAVPFYYCRLEESVYQPGGYLIDVTCHKCCKVWCVVWDDDPIWG